MEPRRREVLNSPHDHSRSDRFVQAGRGWHFRTRENILVGPFSSAFDAQLSASLLCARLSQLDHTAASPDVIRSFMLTLPEFDADDPAAESSNVTPIGVRRRAGRVHSLALR